LYSGSYMSWGCQRQIVAMIKLSI